MSIANKLSYLVETRKQIRDGINKIGGGVTTSDTFRSYADKLEEIYDSLPKVEESDVEGGTLDGTIKGGLKIDLKGNTSQKTTLGTNLIGIIDGSYTTSGSTITFKDGIAECPNNNSVQYHIPVNITLSAGTYTLCNNSSQSIPRYPYIQLMSNETQVAGISYDDRGTKTFTLSESKSIDNVYVYYSSNQSGIITKPMLNTGSSALPFEKFTYGASPNPTYPQPINVVSGDNTIKVEGKNKLNKEIYELGKYIGNDGSIVSNVQNFLFSDYSIVSPNTEYTISANTEMKNFVIAEYDSSKTWIKNTTKSLVQSSSFTTGNTTKFVRVSCNYNYQTITKEIIDTLDIQLEKGNQSSSYVPYTSQTYPISLGTLELCKISTYQDYFYKSEGTWYLHKEIGKVVLNGTEAWYLYSPSGAAPRRFGWQNASRWYANSMPLLSDYFTTGLKDSQIDLSIWTQREYLAITDINSKWEDATALKTWLSTHNTTVYYVLETPTDTEITDTTLINQLDAIENAMSYQTQTNISQENNDKPFIISASALKDLTNLESGE